jgi:SulP family sulfate permease
VLDRIADQRKAFILDLSTVPFMDSTAANTIHGTGRHAARHGVKMFITGASAAVKQVLLAHDLHQPLVEYRATIEDALQEVRVNATPVGAAAKTALA